MRGKGAMGRMVRSFLQSLLKLANSVIGLVGVGMILYSLWMLRVWYKEVQSYWGAGPDSPLPWNSLRVYNKLEHIFGPVTADVFLNSDWEEDFPMDKTGRFNELKNFVRTNFEFCKWIALVVVAAQASSILLAMVLRALGSYRGSYYDSDDDFIHARLPLIRNQVQPTPYIGEARPPLY